MTARTRTVGGQTVYEIKIMGQWAVSTEAEYRRHLAALESARPSVIPAGHAGLRKSKYLYSEAAAVDPRDAAAYEEQSKKLGVPTHFDHEGRPEFTSYRHQRNYLRTQKMHNRRDPFA